MSKERTLTTKLSRLNLVATRRTARTYTHVVWAKKDGDFKAVAWCGREDLAQKEAKSWMKYGFQVEITEVEK